MQDNNQRDLHYDLWKGIAAIGIILNHTVYHSGYSYVPNILRNIVLIIDVPLFFFCSGACQHYVRSIRKQVKSLLSLYLKWVLFLPIYWILIVIMGGNVSTREIFLNLFFLGDGNKLLPIVIGSTWFWPIYFIVVLVGCVFIKRGADCKKLLTFMLCIYILLNILWCFVRNSAIKQIIKLVFYLCVYLFGYYSYTNKISMKIFALLEIIAIVVSGFSVFEIKGFIPMAEAKAPPLITYAFYSLVLILISYYKRKEIRKKNVLSWIGQNCLLFYFAQGISSSILYFIVSYISDINWWAKLFICFMFNLVCSTLIAGALKLYYKAIDSGGILFRNYVVKIKGRIRSHERNHSL